jgi:hypothetical protein
MRIREEEDARVVLVQDEEQKPMMMKCKESWGREKNPNPKNWLGISCYE